MKSDLDAYKQYCDKAIELLTTCEGKAPWASKCIRRALPIINDHIKKSIVSIRERSRSICSRTRGTNAEILGAEVYHLSRDLSTDDSLKCHRSSLRIADVLRDLCELIPRKKRDHAIELVGDIGATKAFPEIMTKIELAISFIEPNIEISAFETCMTKQIQELKSDLIIRLDNINFSIFKTKINSSNRFEELRLELRKLEELNEVVGRSGKKLEDLNLVEQQRIREAEAEVPRIITELEEFAKSVNDPLFKEILLRIEALKTSRKRDLLSLSSDLASIMSLIGPPLVSSFFWITSKGRL